MATAILGLLSSLVGWMLTHLPASPFANISWGDVEGFGTYSLQEILSWVNWLLPFGEMLQLFTAWLGCIVLIAAVRYVIKTGGSIIGGFGFGGGFFDLDV